MASAETFRAFGEKLRAARVQQQRSLEDIASAIKINRRHLEAIEAGNLAELPQGPYVAAFVREYARALGVAVPAEYAPAHGTPPASPRDPKVVSHPASEGEENPLSQIARDTARLASTVAKGAVKTVTKTTEGVVNLVETGSKEALEVLTSRELWEEAENIRRERHGLPPLERKHEAPPKSPVKATPIVPPEPIQHIPVPIEASAEFNPTGRARSSRRVTNLVIAALAIIFAAVAFLAIRSTHQQSGSAVAGKDYVPAPVENIPAPVKSKPQTASPAPPPAPVPAALPAGDSLQFQLRATQPVWVSIAPDGVPAYRGQMSAGEVRSFKAGQKFVIDIGNQKSVAMTFDGAPLSGLPAIHNSNVVVRNLVLTRNHATLGGNEVDLHTLTTTPAAKAPVVNVPPPVPLPPIAKKLEALSKNAAKNAAKHSANGKPTAHSGNAPKTKSHSADTSRSGRSSRHGKTMTPEEPIHPVNPVPPAP